MFCPSIIADYAPGLCQPVDIYCERTGPELLNEPLNALSNAAFFVAAIAAWPLSARHRVPRAANQVALLILIVAIIGAGSLTFHTVAQRWAGWADVVPILVFMLLYLWLVLRQFLAWPRWIAGLALIVFFAATLFLEAAIPEGVWIPGAMYLPALIVLIATALLLMTRQPAAGRAMLAAGIVFVVSFAFRSLDQPLCPSIAIGTHFMWHMLNGLLLFLLLRLAILHMPKAQSES